VYRNGIRLARLQGVDEQTVEQLALDDVRHFMAACIKQSKQDWKAYTKSTGVHAAFVKSKRPAKKKAK
jgi:DNA-binding ferritin-like protein (Dps family)